MANNIYSTVEAFWATDEKLRAFANEMESDEYLFDFNNILKEPDGNSEAKNWYEWREKNWDTKRNWEDAFKQKERWKITYRFTTAWNPPFKVFEALGNKYKWLEFHMSFVDEFWGEHWNWYVTINKWKMTIHRKWEDPFELKNGKVIELNK